MLLLITLTLISTISCTVQVTYLRGVPRLNNTAYWDYYFNGNITGNTLIWEVNGAGLSGFLSTDGVGRVSVGTLPNFNYLATLLSNQEMDGQFTLDSVLIVSVSSKTTLDVVCSNGSSIASTSNIDSTDGVIRNMSMESVSEDSVFEEYLMTERIVGDEDKQTSIFICGVQNTFMYWRGGTNNIEIGFTQFDDIGLHRQYMQQGASTVEEEAILIAREPFQIVSVLFITGSSNVTVACGDPQTEVRISTFDSATMTDSTTTDPEITSRNTLGKLNLYIRLSDFQLITWKSISSYSYV